MSLTLRSVAVIQSIGLTAIDRHARLHEIPAEVKNIILEKYLEDQTICWKDHSHFSRPESENVLAIALVAKGLFSNRSVIDAMLKSATLLSTCGTRILRVNNFDLLQKASIRSIAIRYGRYWLFHDLSDLRDWAQTFNRVRLITIADVRLTYNLRRSSELFSSLKAARTGSVKYCADPECGLLDGVPIQENLDQTWGIAQAEQQLYSAHLSHYNNPGEIHSCIYQEVFGDWRLTDDFLIYLTEKQVELVAEVQITLGVNCRV